MMKKALVGSALLVALAIFAAPAGAQTTVCLDSFPDTMFCGVDNGNNVSCTWDYIGDGSDLVEMIGTLGGGSVTVAGYVGTLDTTYSWVLNTGAGTVNLWLWDAVGDTDLLTSDTFSLNDDCDPGVQARKPALHAIVR